MLSLRWDTQPSAALRAGRPNLRRYMDYVRSISLLLLSLFSFNGLAGEPLIKQERIIQIGVQAVLNKYPPLDAGDIELQQGQFIAVCREGFPCAAFLNFDVTKSALEQKHIEVEQIQVRVAEDGAVSVKEPSSSGGGIVHEPSKQQGKAVASGNSGDS